MTTGHMGGQYEVTFGDVPNKTCYHDPLNFKGLSMHDGDETKPYQDLRESLSEAYVKGFDKIQTKALTSQSGGAGTAGYALVPIYLDPRITDVTRKFTPLVELTPRVTNMGTTADYNRITAKGGAFMAAEDPAMTEHDDTFARSSTSIRFTFSYGRVTGVAQAAVPSYILAGSQPTGGAVGTWTDQSALNAKQIQVLVKTRSVREMEENTIINGYNTTSNNSNNANGTEYDGIVQLQSSTNDVDKNTADLVLDDLETAAEYAFTDGGRPTLAVGSSTAIKDWRTLLKDAYRMSPSDISGANLAYGIPTAITYHAITGPMTVIPSMYLSNTSGSKAIYMLDMSVVEMRVLQDLTYKDLAQTGDSEPFLLKVYESLIIKNTAFNALISEIK